MSKECKQARNMVVSAIAILTILITVMSMSSCSGPAHCAGNKWPTNCPAYR